MKNVIFFYSLNFTFWFQILYSQWVITNGPQSGQVLTTIINNDNLYAGTNGGGVFLSTNNGTVWTNISSGLTNSYIKSLMINGTNIFAGTIGGGVFLSTNNGANWTEVNSGLTDMNVNALVAIGTNLFVGTQGDGVFLSTNNGTTWSERNSGLSNITIYSFAVRDTNLFVGTADDVFISTNLGTSWTAIDSGLQNSMIFSLAFSGQNLVAGTYGQGIFYSTNNGSRWTGVYTGLNDELNSSLTVGGTNIFAGSYYGAVTKSSDNGRHWALVDSNITFGVIFCVAATASNLFAGASNGYVYRHEISTLPVEISFFSGKIQNSNIELDWHTSTEINNYGFEIERKMIGDVPSWNNIGFIKGAGTSNVINKYSFIDRDIISGLYKYRLKQIDNDGVFSYSSEIEITVNSFPQKYLLSQNYPNPFNPVTTISFAVPHSSLVTIKIFNILGEEVAALASEELPSGFYKRQWNAQNIASGVYLCRMQAENFIAVKKLILIR